MVSIKIFIFNLLKKGLGHFWNKKWAIQFLSDQKLMMLLKRFENVPHWDSKKKKDENGGWKFWDDEENTHNSHNRREKKNTKSMAMVVNNDHFQHTRLNSNYIFYVFPSSRVVFYVQSFTLFCRPHFIPGKSEIATATFCRHCNKTKIHPSNFNSLLLFLFTLFRVVIISLPQTSTSNWIFFSTKTRWN